MFEDGKIPLIRTPIPLLQLITGGGIRFSTLVELYGPNRSGKTTTCYQSAGYLLEDYGDQALLKILDSESSVDEVRMEDSFGLDVVNDRRIEVAPAHFLEQGFLKVIEWAKTMPKNSYMMILWDTLSASPTKNDYEALLKDDKKEEEDEEKQEKKKKSSKDKNAKKKKDPQSLYSAGMGARQRVIKHFLRLVMSEIYGKNISLWMPNQVFANISGYGAKEMKGEGTALQHDIHYSLKFQRNEVNIDQEDKVADYTLSHVSLTKSKFSPEFDRCPIFMDNTKGGRIIESTSMFTLAVETGLILESKGFYRLNPEDTGRRWDSILQDANLYKRVLFTLTDQVRRKYPIVDKLYMLNGYPPLEQIEEKKKKKSELACNLTEALKDVSGESRDSLIITRQKKKGKSVKISESSDSEENSSEETGDGDDNS
jgi:RecA/RadA recombinase